MPDIHIQRGYRGMHIITAKSVQGQRWMDENLSDVVRAAGTAEIPIASDYAEEIAAEIRKDGIDVDLD